MISGFTERRLYRAMGGGASPMTWGGGVKVGGLRRACVKLWRSVERLIRSWAFVYAPPAPLNALT